MMDGFEATLSIGCGLVALHLLWHVLRNTVITDLTLYLLGVLEAVLLVQVVIGLVRVFSDHGELNVAAYLGYLVGSLLILPIGFVWAAAERTRSGTAVLLVAVIAVPVLELRLHDLWLAR